MLSGAPHLRLELSSVSSLKMSLVLPVYDETMAQHHGYDRELESWVQWKVSPHALPGFQCWRNSNNGPHCPGNCLNFSAMVTLPLVLIIQFDWTAVDNNGGWQVSGNLLHLFADPELGDIVYEYVGTSFSTSTPSHHTCQFTPDGQYMYSYDGLVAGGTAHFEPDSVTSIQRSVDHPCASSLVYCLKGGDTVQQKFLQHQQNRVLQLHDITIQLDTSAAIGTGLSAKLLRPAWRQLQGHDRYWLEHPLAPSDFADYEQLVNDAEPVEMEIPASAGVGTNGADQAGQFAVDCCCRYQGPMTAVDSASRGSYLACSQCGKMSHEACQRNGWGSMIGPNGFTCHMQSCSPREPGQERPWKSVAELSFCSLC